MLPRQKNVDAQTEQRERYYQNFTGKRLQFRFIISTFYMAFVIAVAVCSKVQELKNGTCFFSAEMLGMS